MKNLNLTLIFISAALLFTGCKKDSATKAGSSDTNITSTYYVKGTLGGKPLAWQAALDGTGGYYVGGESDLSNYQGVVTGGLQALFTGANGSSPQFAVEFTTFNIDLSGDVPTYFNSFVTTGPWAFSSNNDFKAGVKSIIINYTDSSGKGYSSLGAQSGSVNIVSVTKVPAQLGVNEGLKIKLTFSCTLYAQDGSGNTLSLNNAEATVLLIDMLG